MIRDPRVKRARVYRMNVTNRVSGRHIRWEHVEAESLEDAQATVSAKLGAFEACHGGLLQGTGVY